MAQTLSEGPVVPNAGGGEQISETGVAEIRTLGATTNSALASIRVGAEAAAQAASAADSTSRARDVVLEGLIAGMEGMSYVGAWDSGTTYRINDVVTHGGDSWARLTTGAAGEPGASATDWGLVARKGDGGGFGELSETETVGLYDTVDNGVEARLAALEYDTGWRLLPERPAEYTAGRFLVRRTGNQVWLWVDEVRPVDSAAASSVTFPSLIESGMRPSATIYLPVAQRSASYSPGPFRVQSSGTLDIYNNNGDLTVALVSWLTDEARPETLPGTPA